MGSGDPKTSLVILNNNNNKLWCLRDDTERS